MLELNTQEITTPPIPAASIMLLRDSSQGIEVFMLKRSQKSNVLKGVYVFPGGKVEPGDSAPEALARAIESAQAMKARIGDNPVSDTQAAAFFIAACRETQEECGVSVGVSDLVSFSRWTTPRLASFMSKRFDTQFFVAQMPAGQTAKHDNHEAVESVWVRPLDALTNYWNNQLEIAPVQVMCLIDLARFDTVNEALQAYRKRFAPHILPEPFQDGDARVVTYPGDSNHTKPGPVLPGPTRLKQGPNCFVAPGGRFEDFFVNTQI